MPKEQYENIIQDSIINFSTTETLFRSYIIHFYYINSHIFVLTGHTRQGLRCRICKFNVHVDCAAQLPKCQAKQKLLRRQKSTSEIENRVDVEEESK